MESMVASMEGLDILEPTEPWSHQAPSSSLSETGLDDEQRYSFFSFPAEIRNEIYSLLLTDQFRRNTRRPKEVHPKLQPNILLANRRCNEEGTAILYGSNRYHITVHPDGFSANKTPLYSAKRGLAKDWSINVHLLPLWYESNEFSSLPDIHTYVSSLQDSLRSVCVLLTAACDIERLILQFSPNVEDTTLYSKIIPMLYQSFSGLSVKNNLRIEPLNRIDQEQFEHLNAMIYETPPASLGLTVFSETWHAMHVYHENLKTSGDALVKMETSSGSMDDMGEVLDLLQPLLVASEQDFQAASHASRDGVDVEMFQTDSSGWQAVTSIREWLYQRPEIRAMVVGVLPDWTSVTVS